MNLMPALAVTRGGMVESLHRAAVAVVSNSGDLIASFGDGQTPIFLRSTAKIFQAMPLILSGAADRFGLTNEEIAIACSSHQGEAFHLAAVSQLLIKAGLDPSQLQCGTHQPFSKNAQEFLCRNCESPSVLHNNCSGKHAGMLAACKCHDWPLETYLEPSHPLQIFILETIATFCALPASKVTTAIDGCAAPTYALPLKKLAHGFSRFISGAVDLEPALHAGSQRISNAITGHPQLISGDGVIDCELIKAFKGTAICKLGAEGVFAMALKRSTKYPKGVGIALKIEDGSNERARGVIMIEVLRQLGLLDSSLEIAFSRLFTFELKNHRGDTVGALEPLLKLDF